MVELSSRSTSAGLRDGHLHMMSDVDCRSESMRSTRLRFLLRYRASCRVSRQVVGLVDTR